MREWPVSERCLASDNSIRWRMGRQAAASAAVVIAMGTKGLIGIYSVR
jgi:hypothetical protein